VENNPQPDKKTIAKYKYKTVLPNEQSTDSANIFTSLFPLIFQIAF